MSALGQKQTSQRILLMSALPPKADMDQSGCDVRFVPKADIKRNCLRLISIKYKMRDLVDTALGGRPTGQRRAMAELATRKTHHRLLYALAAAAGLGLGLALIAFCDAWFSGSGFSGMQFISAH